MALTPNLGNFANITALSSAFPASSVSAGTSAYSIADQSLVISNGVSWSQVQGSSVNSIAVSFFGGV